MIAPLDSFRTRDTWEEHARPKIWTHKCRQAGRSLMVAHRGTFAVAPGSTRAAFRIPRDRGTDGIETELWLAAGSMVVCRHDANLRDVDGQLVLLSAMPREAVRTACPTIPDLAEALEIGLPMYRDIKARELSRLPKVVSVPAIACAPSRFMVAVLPVTAACALRKAVPILNRTDGKRCGFRFSRTYWGWIHASRATALAALRSLGLRVMITCAVGDGLVGDNNPAELDRFKVLAPDAFVLNDPALAVVPFKRKHSDG